MVLLGDVARDLGKADQPAVVVADRVDHHVGPELAAVTAHAPAFALVAAFDRRPVQVAFRRPVGAILRRIEVREVAAEDVGGLIALEALGARVPTRHMAGRIEHVDGVVVDRVDQQAVAGVVVPAAFDPELLIHPRSQARTEENARGSRRFRAGI